VQTLIFNSFRYSFKHCDFPDCNFY